jgi:hypothetical protein
MPQSHPLDHVWRAWSRERLGDPRLEAPDVAPHAHRQGQVGPLASRNPEGGAMKDLVIIIAIMALVAVGLCGLAMSMHRLPTRIVGVPSDARCGDPGDDGTRTCVTGGVAYTCVTGYGEREVVITCGRAGVSNF